MRFFEFLEYRLSLSTGEEISVSEVDPSLIPEIMDADIAGAIFEVLKRCTRASRDVLELAKEGGPEELEGLLNTPPDGCLLKISKSICAEINTCAISDPRVCTLKRRSNSKPDFPLCWEYEVTVSLPAEKAAIARALATKIVSDWRSGKYVIIVES